MDHQKRWYQSQRTLPDSSTNSTAHTNGGDWQEEVYQKIIVMKEMYLPELSEIYQKIANKLRQRESHPGQTTSDQLEKLKMFKTMLERISSVLQLSKSCITPVLKEKLSLYEKQIINFIDSKSSRKPVYSLRHHPPPEMHNVHLLQQPKVEQQDSNAHDIISQTNDTNGADWQEEVYQKIKVMKETYLPELSKMYQKIASKLHEQESLLRSPNPHMLEKLKMFKTMLERLITVLQLSKSSISPGLKKKLSLYEKQIINFLNTNRPRKPVSSLYLSPSEMQLPKVEQQDQSASNLVQTEGQKCQPHPSQQKYFPIQFQLLHMQQHQLSLQQQSNPEHRDMQQRVQASGQVSGAILQPPNTMELQNQLHQSHRSHLENSSTSLDLPSQTGHTDWLEETYQKILVMKHLYFAELSDMYWKIATKLQLDSLQQQTCNQHKKVSMFKNKLEALITVLHHSKTEISLDLKENLFSYEKQIMDFINTNKLR